MAEAKNQYANAGILSLLQNGLNLIFGLGGFKLLTMMFAPEKWGIWALVLTTTTLFEIARNGMVQNAKIKFYKEASASNKHKVIQAAVVLNVLVSLAAALLLFGIAPLLAEVWNASPISNLLKIYALINIALIPFSSVNFLMQANLNFKGLLVTNATRTGLFFLFILYSFLSNKPPELEVLAFAQLGAVLLAGSVGLLLNRSFLKVEKDQMLWPTVGMLFRYGRFIFGTNFAAILYSSADQFLLGRLVNTQAVGLYNTAIRMNALAEVPVLAAAQVLFPYSVQTLQETRNAPDLEKIYYKPVALILTLLLPFTLAGLIFPELIITILSREAYVSNESVMVLRVFSVGILFQPFMRQFGTLMDSIGWPHINFITVAVAACFNIFLNYTIIQFAGTSGAAFATATTHFLFVIASGYILKQRLRIKVSKAIFFLPWAIQTIVTTGISKLSKK